MSITPKNWSEFQHYKNRSPAWIKLHRGLLDNYEFHRLPLASKALAPLLWLLASEYDKGKITADIDALAFRFRMSPEDLVLSVKPLIESGFFTSDSDLLAPRKQTACLEERRGEREEEREEKETASAVSPEKYVFESGVIRLKADDFEKWEKSFSYLDLRAELIGLTQWASEQPKWFFAISGALAKRNREAKLARERPASARVLQPNGQPWPEGIL